MMTTTLGRGPRVLAKSHSLPNYNTTSCMWCQRRARLFDRRAHLSQDLLVLNDVLVGGEENVKLAAAQLRDKSSSGSRRTLKAANATSERSRKEA